MYKTGDFVVHKVDGLCRITDISSLDIPDCDKTKQYYYLIPTECPTSKIYVAVGSGDASLRDPVTHDEALSLIDSIPDLDEIDVENEKYRQKEYNKALVQNDAKELFRLIKTTHMRKLARLSKGRSATSVDEHFLRSAEHALYSELSYALGIEEDEMSDFIEARLSNGKK
ncbi:transcriptional regulator, CarD family [Lachnospiraceae bacterium]|nr:transcriptional regulator, CarD family [Lachnospiraceae bacterium]